MKRKFTLSVIIALFSVCVFGQAYLDFTPPQKPKHPERPSGYKALLDTYKAYSQQTLKKSASAFSLSMDTAQIQYYLGDNQYLPISNEIIRYDASGNMGRTLIIELNDETYVWENSSKTDFSYDINGNTSQMIREEWDEGTSAWIPTDKVEYSYDANDNLVQIIQYEWNKSLSQFINSVKMDFTLNESGLETQLLVSSWVTDPGSWVEAWKYEYNYDANDLMLVETEYAWDEGTSDWVLSWKAEYTYNENDKLSIKEEFNWDSGTSLWINFWKSTLSYNASGNVIQQLDSTYLEPGGPWQERWTAEYTFDEQNNPLTEIYSQWDENTSMLVLTSKWEYIYENETLLSDLMAPPLNWFIPDYRQQIVNQPLADIIKYYNVDISAYEIIYQVVYYYNPPGFPLGIGSESSPLASIYPNPAHEYITFDFAGEYHQVIFELFDLTGRSLLLKQVENGERLNLEEYQSGIYLYRISGDEQIQTGKLMIK